MSFAAIVMLMSSVQMLTHLSSNPKMQFGSIRGQNYMIFFARAKENWDFRVISNDTLYYPLKNATDKCVFLGHEINGH